MIFIGLPQALEVLNFLVRGNSLMQMSVWTILRFDNVAAKPALKSLQSEAEGGHNVGFGPRKHRFTA